MPRFSSSITRASGNRRRTISSVSSVEPWSTTIVSYPRTLSRLRSIHRSELNVTTTTETSAVAIPPRESDIRLMERRPWDSSEALPEEDPKAGERERDVDDEEEEAGGERLVGVDAELAQEADEERLPDGKPVDGERHEQDEEEQRAHHVVRPRRELDSDRLSGHPDREHADGLNGERQDENAYQEAGVPAVGVDAFIDRAHRPLDAEQAKEGRRPGQHRPQSAREQKHRQHQGRDHEGALDPEVGSDVVASDREREADGRERQRRGAAQRALEQHGGGDRAAVAWMAA